MKKELENLLKEERWRRWHDTSNLFLLSEAEEPTKVARVKPRNLAQDPTKASVRPEDADTDIFGNARHSPVEEPASSQKEPIINPYIEGKKITKIGRAALKANSIWTNNLTQLQNFQAGKRLSKELGQKLANQTGIDPAVGEKIAGAVMRQVLEHLDDLASQEMENEFEGIFNRTRS